ncbi:MAG: OadG family transporter subunit, partial [Bacteroidales bacterium]|nr:OadG family transporter subunit [Bacteroidales bacterium]
MKKKYILLLLLVCLAFSENISAQNMSDMKINEILVINTDDFVDDFGHKSGWIELFNTSYGTVDIGGCYLTNDPENLTKYMIPRGDILTKIKPRQHILFWANAQPFRGTFHISFTLEESKEILLVSSDGRTILDRVAIPHEILQENISYGRLRDGEDVKGAGKVTDINATWGVMERTSPSSSNYGADLEPAGMLFMKVDPYGVIMAITAMSVVFLSLILLYVVFKHVGKYNIGLNRRRAELASAGSKKVITDEETSAEVFAAIAASLHSYFEDDESHDFENTILTIEKVAKNYSPWSSKIYTLRETPN